MGLKARVDGRTLAGRWRSTCWPSPAQGLKNRGRIGASMTDETGFLASLDEIAETGVTPAERWLELYNGAWHEELASIYEAAAY